MKNVKTIPIKVSEQLKNVATKNGESLDEIGHRYFQERWLYRLSISAFQERFLLKGDHLLATLTNGLVKPSVIISLSAKQITQDISKLQHVFEDICAIKVPEDGVDFLVDELKITALKEDVSIEIPVILGQMRTYIQIKISYKDNHILTPKEVTIPTLLEMEPPVLLAYSTEVIIAEKFEAMISLVEEDNRMKDFYDVYVLLNTQSFEGRVLQEAVLEVFDKRRTLIEKDQAVLKNQFYLDAQRNEQWLVFVGQKSLFFEEVIKRLQKVLVPIYDAIVTEDEFFGNWDCELQDWK
ncbi:hypothetical protein AEA09_07355 [Lysinibacillus contaminans]|uniref:Transcriptional regulator n=1 Tax=Lysinibacillus contaminans TaxID=1293441 RepID=A0ABR5K0D6_9BACI|nr:nucleotidyl transferase AbiEii/AbiGii toxin family protein [Lysinibacillus contaminans]KOS68390.1 hypothetical protein AEA09_07355 [Lysinibacillus contaminans]